MNVIQNLNDTMENQPIQNFRNIFKATFQKPSHIYKFLRERWNDHPLYLNRTLSYVSKHRNKTILSKNISIELIARRLLKNQTNSDNSKTSRNNPCAKDSEKVCYFNWVCDDPARTSQKTKSYGFICPWCEIDLNFLDSLMAHLKYVHLRFTFNLLEDNGQSIIEMTLNKSFDGSYCGFKYPGHDLRRDFRFTPCYPERRTPITQIIFFRTKKSQNSRSITKIKHGLSAIEGDTFAYDSGEADVDVCSGRLYYHTSTCLPVKPNEVDIDSEADMDPDWLRERTQLMIDEFTDVNEGEKEILKLWNLHIMKNYKYKSDNMMPQACYDFVELEGSKILSKNLSKNFTLHLANLYDFGLLGSGDLIGCIRKLNKLRPVSSSPSKTTGRTKSERNSNEHCQHSSPAKRASINSHCNH